MPTEIYIRITSYVLIALSFFCLPWWCGVLLLLWYSVYYTPVVEIIALGFLADQVYGVAYTYTLFTTFLCLLVYFVRSRIRV